MVRRKNLSLGLVPHVHTEAGLIWNWFQCNICRVGFKRLQVAFSIAELVSVRTCGTVQAKKVSKPACKIFDTYVNVSLNIWFKRFLTYRLDPLGICGWPPGP